MKEIYDEYIESKTAVWAATSIKSESSRLNSYWSLINGDPGPLWKAFTANLQPYARATYWTRVSAFWEWGIKYKKFTSPNPYQIFREENVQCFRNVYLKKPCGMNLPSLREKIESIPAEYEDIKNAFRLMLAGGLRKCELHTITEDGYVKGKGGKVRKVYVPKLTGPVADKARYSTMLKLAHRYLGITPHKIRSAKMSAMARKDGMTLKDLMEFAGWSSMGTADSYLAANQDLIEKAARED